MKFNIKRTNQNEDFPKILTVVLALPAIQDIKNNLPVRLPTEMKLLGVYLKRLLTVEISQHNTLG
jgi:hypothetical protein